MEKNSLKQKKKLNRFTLKTNHSDQQNNLSDLSEEDDIFIKDNLLSINVFAY
jgi:hypothetical protein